MPCDEMGGGSGAASAREPRCPLSRTCCRALPMGPGEHEAGSETQLEPWPPFHVRPPSSLLTSSVFTCPLVTDVAALEVAFCICEAQRADDGIDMKAGKLPVRETDAWCDDWLEWPAHLIRTLQKRKREQQQTALVTRPTSMQLVPADGWSWLLQTTGSRILSSVLLGDKSGS
ncbi:hypothetical protein AV530_013248 [Patagioenas fasciata monilis]|uniref:Uncharacterized protein n=1 Tax=Patagioenas fasciata monilis TaxID=372326 RepID=A0A1V4JP31_PATFA|nr:hypothetical protein AV530_013248 [Patagioenas fasciata monilis]